MHRFPAARLLRASALILVVGVAAGVLAVEGSHSARILAGHQLPRSRQALTSLPLTAQGPISRRLGAVDPRYRVRLRRGALYAFNPAQGLHAWFRESGTSIGVGSHRLTLALRAAGYGSNLRPVGVGTPRARANQIVYARRGVDEWYANGPVGIEQGFTVGHPIAGNRPQPLTLALTVSGDLRPVLVSHGRGLVLESRGRRPIISYSGLVASDAAGRQLSAWLSLTDNRLLLHVDQQGARYPLRIDPVIQETAKLTAPDYGPSNPVDDLGWSVAVSSDGSTVVAGAPGALIVGNAYDQGAVYVFTKPSSGWADNVPTAKLTASDGAGGDVLGESVGVSADGSTVVAGAPSAAVGTNTTQGAVYVFTKPSSGWANGTETAKLTASDGAKGDQLGSSTAISGDGSTVVAGAPNAAITGHTQQGAVYVFTKSSTGWASAAKLTAHDGASGDVLGQSAAISSDGSVVVAGAPFATVGTNSGQGAAYLFTESASGWSSGPGQINKVTASDGAANDEFGSSVAISADDSTMVAGAPRNAVNRHAQGAAYVFTELPSGWGSGTQAAKLTASNGGSGDQLGASVAASQDGSTVLAGAPFPTNGGTPGAAYVFTKPSSGWADGTESAELTASDGVSGDVLGHSVALSSDGSIRIGGAPTNSNTKQGAVYVFGLVTPTMPTVATGTATGVQPGSATLNGTVTPNSAAITACKFDYGTTTTYDQTVQCAQQPGDGTSPVPVSAALTGLTPGTTYHYRLSATNVKGSGLGQDQTFTTPGAAAPTATLSGAAQTQWGNSTAGVTGTVNPHASTTTYWFDYGTSSVAVTSPGDLQGYPSASATGSINDGTADVGVAGQLTGLQADTVYYYRLVASNAYGESWSSEQTLEIVPPVPMNVGAPYLQANGSDATTGYEAKCIPGQWQDAENRYQIEWVYVDPSGYGRAPGQTETFQYPGDGYKVTAQDIGHALQCRVFPYALDGTPSPANAGSDTLLPEAPSQTVFPKWMKQLWAIAYNLDTANSIYSTLVDCIEFADIPYLDGVICSVDIAEVLYGNPIEDQMNKAIDPPDRAYRQIALPPPAPHGAPIHCDRRAPGGRCARLRRLAGRYAQATGGAASLFELIMTSANRTLVARTHHDTVTEQIQEAARKVYFGWLAQAAAAQHSAGIEYARALQTSHIDIKAPASALRRIAHEPLLKLFGRKLLASAVSHGYQLAELKATFAREARHVKGFDLLHLLRTSIQPAPFTRYYDTLDLTDLTALVTGLVRQGALPTQAQNTLDSDLAAARAACSQAARAAALHGFLSDADRSLAATYRSFLGEAAAPLISGSSSVDPYPPCAG